VRTASIVLGTIGGVSGIIAGLLALSLGGVRAALDADEFGSSRGSCYSSGRPGFLRAQSHASDAGVKPRCPWGSGRTSRTYVEG